MKPCVSILIPNFNNGKPSSKTGEMDFITTLLRSLRHTLSDELAPFEIIAYDDGSTDDSLDTLRAWAEKRWTSGVMTGQPLLRLIEAAHHGCLAKTTNILVSEAVGDILVRLDGDIEILTPSWVSILRETFDAGPPDLGVVGPKQLASNGRIHSMGDWILDPRGYIHEGEHEPRDAYRHTIEVDHVMGCFYCFKRDVFDAVGGFDETFLRGQTIDFGMMSRLKGYRCWATPAIEFFHHLTMRRDRANTADTTRGLGLALGRFRDKWGFCRLQPDLDEVRRQYRSTPLLWNARVFGPSRRQVQGGEIDIAQTPWARFSEDSTLRAICKRRADCIAACLSRSPEPRRFAEVGCGAGLFVHLLAQQGVSCIGLDADGPFITLASCVTGEHEYAGPKPEFRHITDDRHLPLDDDAVDVLLLTDVLERHANPVRLLAEARRCIAPGGSLVVVSQRPDDRAAARISDDHRYKQHQLRSQLQLLVSASSIEPFDAKPDLEMIFTGVPEPTCPLDVLAGEVQADHCLIA
ncbi:MAG: methyltransferase domain-containing protein [Phycisphaerales bacterium]|nr:methyltransferase domain-containing protein [Phycisphaerales bacterium]